MSMPCMSFGIMPDDVIHVLHQAPMTDRAFDSPIDEMGEEILENWGGKEFNRVAMAALSSGTDIDEQIHQAHLEIKHLLVEQGVLRH